MVLSEKERKNLYSIRIASKNDPAKPEFPPDNHKFPATPIYKINVLGFSNEKIKDEIFFSGSKYPCRTGYSIGHHLVKGWKKYLIRHNST